MKVFAARLVRGFFAALPLAPFLPALLHGVPGLGWLGQAWDAWFAFHCHREPARMLPGMATCLRCYGIYLGLGLGALVLRPRLSAFSQRVWVLGAALILVLDVASEALALRPPWAPLRLVTGALFAYPVSLGVVQSLADQSPAVKPSDG